MDEETWKVIEKVEREVKEYERRQRIEQQIKLQKALEQRKKDNRGK